MSSYCYDTIIGITLGKSGAGVSPPLEAERCLTKNSRNLLFHLSRKMHWGAGLATGKKRGVAVLTVPHFALGKGFRVF